MREKRGGEIRSHVCHIKTWMRIRSAPLSNCICIFYCFPSSVTLVILKNYGRVCKKHVDKQNPVQSAIVV
jgi:hypothetical protein